MNYLVNIVASAFLVSLWAVITLLIGALMHMVWSS